MGSRPKYGPSPLSNSNNSWTGMTDNVVDEEEEVHEEEEEEEEEDEDEQQQTQRWTSPRRKTKANGVSLTTSSKRSRSNNSKQKKGNPNVSNSRRQLDSDHAKVSSSAKRQHPHTPDGQSDDIRSSDDDSLVDGNFKPNNEDDEDDDDEEELARSTSASKKRAPQRKSSSKKKTKRPTVSAEMSPTFKKDFPGKNNDLDKRFRETKYAQQNEVKMYYLKKTLDEFEKLLDTNTKEISKLQKDVQFLKTKRAVVSNASENTSISQFDKSLLANFARDTIFPVIKYIEETVLSSQGDKIYKKCLELMKVKADEADATLEREIIKHVRRTISLRRCHCTRNMKNASLCKSF